MNASLLLASLSLMAGAPETRAKALARISSIANHLVLPIVPQVRLSNASKSKGEGDSYHRIHGEVSSAEVTWRAFSDGQGPEFTDIIYEKAVGEGIAKVRWLWWELVFCCFQC